MYLGVCKLMSDRDIFKLDFREESKAETSKPRRAFRSASLKLIGFLFALFCVFSIVGYFTARMMKPQYSVSLQFYIPNNAEDFSNKLSALSSQLTFLSLPAQWRVPVKLISKKIQDEETRKWVKNQLMQERRISSVKAIGAFDDIQIDTHYNIADQVLLLRGSAGTQEIAKESTVLYSKYLESELQQMWRSYLTDLAVWSEAAEKMITVKVNELSLKLSKLKMSTENRYQSAELIDRLYKESNELNVEIVQLKLDIADIKNKLNFKNWQTLSDSKYQEVSTGYELYLKLDEQLSSLEAKDSDIYKMYTDRISNIRSEIYAFLGSKLKSNTDELNAKERRLNAVNSKVHDLKSSNIGFSSYKEQVLSLENQINQHQESLKGIGMLESQVRLNLMLNQKLMVPLQEASSIMPTLGPYHLYLFLIGFLLSIAVSVAFFIKTVNGLNGLRNKLLEFFVPTVATAENNQEAAIGYKRNDNYSLFDAEKRIPGLDQAINTDSHV
jgi:hypothetical protein